MTQTNEQLLQVVREEFAVIVELAMLVQDVQPRARAMLSALAELEARLKEGEQE